MESAYRKIFDLHFAQHDHRHIVYHQIASFNHFMEFDLMDTILRSCPIRVVGSPDLTLTGTTRAAAGTAGTAVRISVEDATVAPSGTAPAVAAPGGVSPSGGPPREVEVILKFENVSIRKPTIFENNGSITPMYPNDARLRNLTYSAPIYVDLNVTTTLYDPASNEKQTSQRTLPHVLAGKIPVMVGSKFCLLSESPEKTPRELGECAYDPFGYFIIQGGERAIIPQERMAENRMFVFRNNRGKTKEAEVIECKSIGPDNEGSPKSMAVKILYNAKNPTGPEHIRVTLPRIKAEVPLFIMFRALGVISDKEIVELINGNIDTEYDMILMECILDAGEIFTKEAAHELLSRHLGSGGGIRETLTASSLSSVRSTRDKAVSEIIAEEFLPHVGGADMAYEKACFLAVMTKKVLDVYHNKIPYDDRDAYPNKKIELPGNLLGNLFRYHFATKLIKDMKSTIMKEIHNGTLKTTGKFENIINPSNVFKILKSTIVDVGMKSALATGNFPFKMGTRLGISQVMNRLTYLAGISHLRRISTPIEKTGKLVAPRKLHTSQIFYMCPCETPEGHSVGVVKNLACTATATLPSSPAPILKILYDELHIQHLIDTTLEERKTSLRVFINGAWIGIIQTNSIKAVEALRVAKRAGRIHPFTGIAYNPNTHEVWINTEGGRLIRPIFLAAALREISAKTLPFPWDTARNWNDLMHWVSPGGNSLLEFIDPSESENCYIAYTVQDLKFDHTHVEIHPSAILGTMACNIPFLHHNQSPRNAYQCLWEHETVRMADGSEKEIRDVRVGDTVLIVDKISGFTKQSSVIYHYVRDTEKPLFKITTATGRSIIATNDHRFPTYSGDSSVTELGKTSMLGYYPGTIPLSTESESFEILTKASFESTLKALGMTDKLIKYHITILSSAHILPLLSTDWKVPILAKMCGFIETDGSANIYNKLHGGFTPQVAADFGLLEDAMQFENDIARLGLPSIIPRISTGVINGATHTTYKISHNGAYASLMIALGISLGKLTDVSRPDVPSWIKRSSNHVIREYLSGFQGGDGCKIRFNWTRPDKGGWNVVCANTTQQTHPDNSEALAKYMNSMIDLLMRLGIDASFVKNSVKDLELTRVQIGYKPADTFENLIKLFDTIGYAYDSRKMTESAIVVSFLKEHIRQRDIRIKQIELIRTDIDNGCTRATLSEKYKLSMATLSDIERSHKAGRKISASKHSIDFDEWSAKFRIRGQIIYEPIELIIPYTEKVKISDITVSDENHTFISSHGIVSCNCSMGKQAMGLYALNYTERLDTMSNVLCYNDRPLISSYMAKYFRAIDMPSGKNIIVAIAQYGGYNQEDSIMINRASIERGLFRSFFYRTYKDEEKKNQASGEEERFCKPDPSLIKSGSLKGANYEKLAADGLVPENVFVDSDDILIGKVVPIRLRAAEGASVAGVSHSALAGMSAAAAAATVQAAGGKRYRDASKGLRNNETGWVDKIYKGRNGEGFSFVKIRVRSERIPTIGDKLCLTDDHEVMTRNRGWISIKDVSLEDEVYQRNEDGSLEAHTPLNLIHLPYTGSMVEFITGHSSSTNLIVTPDHKMFVQLEQNGTFTEFHLLSALELMDILDKNIDTNVCMESMIDSVKHSVRISGYTLHEINPGGSFVYCIEVPSHVFPTRRKNTSTVFMTGNCSRHG
jgi:DNA-directed RNA polymerase beta subunit